MPCLRIGVTGNIGSGKTTVCKIFQAIDIPVYYADDRAKGLMVNHRELRSKIKYLLGPQSYIGDDINRKFISSRVFNNKDLLAKLNSLVHPIVGQDTLQWFEMQSGPYAITEAALLIESSSYLHMDRLIVVAADKESRIARVIKRDGVARDTVLARIDNQMTQEEKMPYADFIIRNDNKQGLIHQVWTIHRNIVKEICQRHFKMST